MSGQQDRAQAILLAAQVEDTAVPGSPRARIITSSGFVHWIAADLPSQIQAVQAALRVCQDANLYESCTWSRYFLASAHYHRNDLEAAEEHARAVEERRYAAHPTCVLHNAFVLAAVQQACGLPDQALQTLERANAFLLETHSEPVMPVHGGYRAELALAQGDPDYASHWARTVGPLVPLGIMAFFYAPQLTLPKVLLAMNTPTSRQEAAETLAELHAFVTATHNTRFTIEVLALQALLQAAESDEPAALRALEQAVHLARPGGLVRVFVDLGPAMERLFQRLAERGGPAAHHVEHVLDVFRSVPFVRVASVSGPPRPSRAQLVEPLTNRELEVLELLARRLSNKEIAQRLVLSPQTVKRHTANIYLKLGVHGRREAMEKGRALGILEPR
jgi:LuxR family maltose regulon positive regulatory protein